MKSLDNSILDVTHLLNDTENNASSELMQTLQNANFKLRSKAALGSNIFNLQCIQANICAMETSNP